MTKSETEQTINSGQKACDESRFAEAINLLMKARTEAKGNGWHYLEYRAAYNLGVAYFYITDYSDALHYYNEAYKISIEQKLGDEKTDNVLNGIAGIYFNEGNWKKVEEITRQCLSSALQHNDSTKVVTYSSNLSLLYNKLCRLADSKKVFSQSEPYLKGCHNEDALKAKEQEVKINSRLRSLLKNDTKLDDFMVQFESLYPNFVHNVQQRHPDLTVSDIRFIAYLKMNLSNKEIASLLSITPDSCTRKKIRLSKRLGLNSSRDLYSYIASF